MKFTYSKKWSDSSFISKAFVNIYAEGYNEIVGRFIRIKDPDFGFMPDDQWEFVALHEDFNDFEDGENLGTDLRVAKRLLREKCEEMGR